MKLNLTICALFVASTFSAHAFEVTEKRNAPLEAKCAVTGDITIYGNKEFQLKNTLSADGVYIVSSRSKIQINVLNDKAIVSPDFSQPTNFTPGPGRYLVAWQNGKTKLNLPALEPKDRYSVIAQLVYQTRRVPQGDGIVPDSELISVEDSGDTSLPGKRVSHGKNSLRFNVDKAYEDLTCQNILPKWCGDGVVDKEYGETCDAGKLNGAVGSKCSATCQSAVQ